MLDNFFADLLSRQTQVSLFDFSALFIMHVPFLHTFENLALKICAKWTFVKVI